MIVSNLISNSEMFRKVFDTTKDGQIFEHEGRRFMKLTGMVAFELATEERFFKAIDF